MFQGRFFFIILFSILINSIAYARPAVSDVPPSLITAQQQLSGEQVRQAILIDKLKVLQVERNNLSIENVNDLTVQRAQLIGSMAVAEVDSVNLNLNVTKQSLELLQNDDQGLQDDWQNLLESPAGSSAQQAVLKQKLDQRRQLIIFLQKRVKTLQKNGEIAQRIVQLAQSYQLLAQNFYQNKSQLKRQEALDQLTYRLQQSQAMWSGKLLQLSKQLASHRGTSFLNSKEYSRLEFEVFDIEEKSNLIQLQLDLAKVVAAVQGKDIDLNSSNISVSDLNILQRQLLVLQDQVKDMEALIRKKIEFLNNYSQLSLKNVLNNKIFLKNSGVIVPLKNLFVAYQSQLTETLKEQTHIQQTLASIIRQSHLQIANRQSFPVLDIHTWTLLVKNLVQIPKLTVAKLTSLYQPLVNRFGAFSWGRIILSGIIGIFWIGIWYKLRQYLLIDTEKMQQRNRGFFSAQLLIGVLQLLHRHLALIMLILGLIGALLFFDLPIRTYTLLISCIFVILIFSVVIQLAHIILLENTTDESGHDVRLYFRLKWALLVGAIITLITILVHQLPINYEIQDLFSRLFMFLLLVLGLVLMKSWEVMPTILEPYLESKNAHLRRIVRSLSFLVPLSLLSNALIGLAGFVALAWAIAIYQGLFLLAFTAYLLVRGLLDELIRWLSEECIRRFRNGWLWSQALLKPLHQILKIAFLIMIMLALATLYFFKNKPLLANQQIFWEALNKTLFSMFDTPITTITLFELTLVGCVLMWIGHWAREFAYRWVFSHIKDLSLRNSMAIFAQYLLIAIGITTGLKLAGLTYKTLTFVFGGIGLGVGFGLRDLANNFVTGILLLIERPVKIGDWVTIGTYDGQVSHIGARSITVSTSDHQELIVPNADIFSKNFINWTHSDSIVRIVLVLRVQRKDDPLRVKQLIHEVLLSIPKILTSPKSEVYLREMAEVLLEFRVEFYVDMNYIYSRSEVRSQFLFALWERFEKEGISPPDTLHEILIHNEKADLIEKRGAPEEPNLAG